MVGMTKPPGEELPGGLGGESQDRKNPLVEGVS
jgi:hypothetical protein